MNSFEIWSETSTVSYGYVLITNKVSIKPGLESDSCQFSSSLNCEQLTPTIQVSWQVTGQKITFTLKGQIKDQEYLAFGISGKVDQQFMEGADFTVIYYDSKPNAVDYYVAEGYKKKKKKKNFILKKII